LLPRQARSAPTDSAVSNLFIETIPGDSRMIVEYQLTGAASRF
jgi:hypothetical protein